MSRRVRTIQDVVEGQLCTGCGACSFAEPRVFEMRHTLEYGRRPFKKENVIGESGEAFAVCPGHNLEHDYDRRAPDLKAELNDGWGPVLDVWEGYAAGSISSLRCFFS